MRPSVGLGNLIQAGIFGAGAWWLRERWGLSAGIVGLCALAQIVGAVCVFTGRSRGARWCSIASLVGTAVLLGLYLAAGNHLMEAYGSDARKIGENSRMAVLGVLPWAVGFPLWQALCGGLRSLITPLVALLIPLLWGVFGGGPDHTWPEQPDQEAAAQAAFSRWTGTEATLPSGVGPATILLTPLANGRAGKAVRGDGDTLADAVAAALDQLPPATGSRPALILDVARALYPAEGPVPAGDGGGLGKKSGTSPAVAWRPGRMGSLRVAPKWVIPRPKIKKQRPTRFDTVVADTTGAHPISGGWAAPEPLTAESALAAALAGGRMLARHQTDAGRYAYTVRSPSGKVKKKGYNFPRHAGTTWFLARLAARTGDPEIIEATSRGLAYMKTNTSYMSDGGAYFHDKRRGDGKTWAGTTALGALAAVVAKHELAGPYGRFLAASVDDMGQVRGEMDMKSEAFPPQKKNPYGQGQVVLALAALARAGHDDVRDALERGAAYMDGDYAPGGAGRLVVLDEHWTCLSALAVRDVLGHAAGQEVCEAYLSSKATTTPNPGSRIRPQSGAAGGLAEAVVAGAVLNPDGPHTERAKAFGAWFLRNVYQAADAPLLPKPRALLGGFRDTPYRLDVRMDAVQHIGCALLGIEALLSDTHPGSLP